MAETRLFTDGVTLEECEVQWDGVLLFTSARISTSAKQEKKLLYGAGSRKAFGRARGAKKFEFSIEVQGINSALLVAPADRQSGQGAVQSFELGGTTYTSLLDLRNGTMTIRHPSDEGSWLERVMYDCEFGEDSDDFGLEDAVGRTLTGEATDEKGRV